MVRFALGQHSVCIGNSVLPNVSLGKAGNLNAKAVSQMNSFIG